MEQSNLEMIKKYMRVTSSTGTVHIIDPKTSKSVCGRMKFHDAPTRRYTVGEIFCLVLAEGNLFWRRNSNHRYMSGMCSHCYNSRDRMDVNQKKVYDICKSVQKLNTDQVGNVSLDVMMGVVGFSEWSEKKSDDDFEAHKKANTIIQNCKKKQEDNLPF